MSSQLHDFSPWDMPNGLFWTVKVPDNAVEITDNTLKIHLADVPEVDAFSFPPPVQQYPGISPVRLVPAKLSFDITYTKSGNPRRVRPASDDPLSPVDWSGEMWDATNSGTFSLSYDDGTFAAWGSFDSSGNFGEMGTERNGVFVDHKEEDANVRLGTAPFSLSVNPAPKTQLAGTGIANQRENFVLLKGRVPVNVTH